MEADLQILLYRLLSSQTLFADQQSRFRGSPRNPLPMPQQLSVFFHREISKVGQGLVVRGVKVVRQLEASYLASEQEVWYFFRRAPCIRRLRFDNLIGGLFPHEGDWNRHRSIHSHLLMRHEGLQIDVNQNRVIFSLYPPQGLQFLKLPPKQNRNEIHATLKFQSTNLQFQRLHFWRRVFDLNWLDCFHTSPSGPFRNFRVSFFGRFGLFCDLGDNFFGHRLQTDPPWGGSGRSTSSHRANRSLRHNATTRRVSHPRFSPPPPNWTHCGQTHTAEKCRNSKKILP